MADNVQITAGAGTTIRTDDIGAGVQDQVMKIALGADGAEDLLLDSGQQTKANSLPVTIASDDKPMIQGSIAHDSADADKPVKIGAKTVGYSGLVSVADADVTNIYANRHGVLMVIGGDPGVVTSVARSAAAWTDQAIGPGAVSAGSRVVVTRITFTVSNACSVNVDCKIGFGTATLPADSTSGASGLLADHEGVPPGGGFTVGDGAGILGVGADDAELRITTGAATGGFACVSVTYYLLENS